MTRHGVRMKKSRPKTRKKMSAPGRSGQKHKIGMPAGTLMHVGEKKADKAGVSIMSYGPDHFHEQTNATFDPKAVSQAPPGVVWVNMDGLHDVKAVEDVGRHFKIHPLVLEDVLNTEQRPKAEEYDGYMFAVMKILWRSQQDGSLFSEQASLIWGESFLVSFQELPQDVFNSVRERIRMGRGRLRHSGADFLAYALMDAMVDQYFPILDLFSEGVEEVETGLSKSEPDPRILTRIHGLRREVLFIRRQIWPVREMVSTTAKAGEPLMTRETAIFMRDVMDHIIQAVDTVDILRETTLSLQDLYLSLAGQRGQRDHEDFDHHGRHFHSPHLYRGGVRHELQIHARAVLAMGIPGGLAGHGGGGRRHGGVFQTQKVAIAGGLFGGKREKWRN